MSYERAEFENRHRSKPTSGRFRDRHWPAFARTKVRRWRKPNLAGHNHERISRAIKRAARIAEVRGWLPYADLSDGHYMFVCDAVARYWKRDRRVR